MRGFWIALVLFAVTVALIVIGTVYGRWVCREMETLVEALPGEPSTDAVTRVRALQAYWQSQVPYLRPMVNRTVIRTMSDLVGDLSVYAAPGLDAAQEYHAARCKLLGAIDEMRRSEKATFGLWA